MANIKFTVDCEMEERWAEYFVAMLKQMEKLGNIGSSCTVGLYADGDGDFRPKFTTDIQTDKKPFTIMDDKTKKHIIIFDAG